MAIYGLIHPRRYEILFFEKRWRCRVEFRMFQRSLPLHFLLSFLFLFFFSFFLFNHNIWSSRLDEIRYVSFFMEIGSNGRLINSSNYSGSYKRSYRLVDSPYPVLLIRCCKVNKTSETRYTYELCTKWSDEERDIRNNIEGLPLS